MFRWPALAAAVLIPLVTACDDDPTEPVPVNLTGTWSLTRIELVSTENPLIRVDMIDEGVTATLVLAAGGDYSLTLVDPVEGTETLAGDWTHTDTLILECLSGGFAGTTWEFQVEVRNGVLELTGADGQYDFDDDGEEDPAILNLTAVRVG